MDVIMGLRTEDITVVNGQEVFPADWKAEGIVEVVEPLGSETNLHLDLLGTKLVARCDGGRTIKAGDRVPLALNLNHLHIFDAASEQSLY
jgi:multiple sugar transport system ATP-binding protein